MREQKLIKKISMFAASLVAACMILVAAPSVAEAAGMTVTQTAHTANTATIAWTPVPGATFYMVPTASGSYEKVMGTSYTFQGLSEGCKYGVAVYAYDQTATSIYDYFATSGKVYIATTPKVYKMYLENWKPATNSAVLSCAFFNSPENAKNYVVPDGYDVEVVNNKGKKIFTKNAQKWNYDYYYGGYCWTLKSSKIKNKGFSIRIKPYFTVGTAGQKIEGSWSAWKTVVPQPSVSGKYSTNYRTRTKKVTLKWKKVTGAKSYSVYRKTGLTSGGKYKKVKTVKGTSFSQTVDYSKSYQYYVVANKVPMKVNGKKKNVNSEVKDSVYILKVY